MNVRQKQALIIGASRGLGRGLVQELQRRGWLITATVRDMAVAEQGTTRWLELDINQPQSIAHFLPQVAGRQYDLIFINAGVMSAAHDDAAQATPEELLALFQTNAVSPIRMAKHLLPQLAGEGVLALMTSQLGSLTLNETGIRPLYAASKAALNMLTRHLAAELAAKESRVAVLSLHPGWVKTDMGGEEAPLTVEVSVRGLVDQVEQATGQPGHRYLDYQGNILPW